jgi:hypothetical protein
MQILFKVAQFWMPFNTDGSVFTQMGSFSTDGSTRMGSIATGIGAVFNDRDDWSSAPGIEKDQS